MPIDQKLSDQFRMMLSYAMQNRVEDFAAGISELGYQRYEELIVLAINATAYVVIDAGERYPNDADLEKVSEIAGRARTDLPIDQDEIHAYLSKVVFGSERVVNILEDRQKAAVLPMFALANLIVSLLPQGIGDQWSYLDVIEASIDTADNMNEGVLPSMVYRFMHK